MQHSRRRSEGRPPDPEEVADRIIKAFKSSTHRMRVTVIDGDEHRPPRVEAMFQMKRPTPHIEVALKFREAVEGAGQE